MSACKAPTAQFNLPTYGELFAPKRVMDSAGNLRGPIQSTIKSHPKTLPNYGTSPQQAFNADFSHVPLAIEMNLIGDALGDPASLSPPVKYLWGRTAAAIYIRAFNASGVNNSDRHGENRTGYGTIVVDFNNASHNANPDKIGGDMSPLVFNGFASTVRPHAVSFLANPAITGVAGQLKAGIDGVWMEPYGDLNCVDGGFDAACLSVLNLHRENATGNLNANFVGSRIQSTGRKPIDAFLSAVGPGVTGLDLTAAVSGDRVLMRKPAIASGGSGYAAGDKLTIGGGECDQQPVLQVAEADGRGRVTAVHVERRGMCSQFPASPAAASGGHGSGAAFEVAAAPQIAMQMPQDSYIFGAATCDRNVFGTCFPSTTTPGASYFGYSSTSQAWQVVADGAPSLQVGKSEVTVGPMLVAKGGVTAALRSITAGAADAIDPAGAEPDYVVIWRVKGGEKTERLPACAAENKGRLLTIKDGAGDAGAHPILVKPAAGTIEGEASYAISSDRAALQLQCDGERQDWVRIN